MKTLVIVILIAILAALASCARVEHPDPEAWATYPINVAPNGMAQLQRGLFEAEAAPGSASKIRIQLMETPRASGDLNDDGADDKVVILNAETGGSGAFTYLAAVLYENGEAKPVASVLLGDRIQLRTIGIDHGIIRVTLLTRRPDEPMTAAPTVEERKSFKLEDGRLREFVVIGATAPRPIRSGAPRSNPEAPIVESVR